MMREDLLQHIKAISTRYPVSSAYLFGSQAVGRAGSGSDYDFAFLLSPRIKKERYLFYKLLLMREVLKCIPSDCADVVILNDKQVPVLLKYNIIKNGRVLCDKDPLYRTYTESCIMREWFDQEYFEQLWYTIFTKNLAQGKII